MAAPVYRALISYFQEQEKEQEQAQEQAQRGGREGSAHGHGNDHHDHDHDHDELPGLVVADVAAIGALWYSHRAYSYAHRCLGFFAF
jgi:hypothetical protein